MINFATNCNNPPYKHLNQTLPFLHPSHLRRQHPPPLPSPIFLLSAQTAPFTSTGGGDAVRPLSPSTSLKFVPLSPPLSIFSFIPPSSQISCCPHPLQGFPFVSGEPTSVVGGNKVSFAISLPHALLLPNKNQSFHYLTSFPCLSGEFQLFPRDSWRIRQPFDIQVHS